MQGWHYGKGLIYLTANISANKFSLPQYFWEVGTVLPGFTNNLEFLSLLLGNHYSWNFAVCECQGIMTMYLYVCRVDPYFQCL